MLLRHLFEARLPIIDEFLASDVIDAALAIGFDLGDLSQPSEWDDPDLVRDEDDIAIENVMASMHNDFEHHIQPAIQGNNLRIYRAVAVPSVHMLKTDDLGIHWATDITQAHPYWGKSKGQWIILHALVSLDHIWWAQTFALHMEGGETEVRLQKGTPVTIIKVEWKSDKGSFQDNTADHLVGKTLTV